MNFEYIVNIRPGTVADIPRIMRLERQCATAAHWTEEQYLQAFQPEGPPRLVLLAEASPPRASHLKSGTDAGSSILGFLIAHHLVPEWELENVAVAPTARQKGLGKRLLDALLVVARETNSSSVFLEVRESNAAARTLYEKAGFEQAGRRKSYYTDPLEDAVLYRRNPV
ncbi:MAG: ribosomal protein S18-alanine N-acetyltransferase [Candidatus Sulfotelmatobacter sp.]